MQRGERNSQPEHNVAAVIVRWRGGKLAERCVRSLVETPPPQPCEIVVVDSGSGDNGAQRLALTFPGVRVEALEENIGFAAAANHGVAATSSPFILLLNPDTAIVENGLSTLVSRLGSDPGLAGVVPLLENPDGTTQFLWQLRKLPTVIDLGLGRSGRPAFSVKPTGGEFVPQPAAAAWLIRRTVWDALGGMDGGFVPAWWEDVDFCRRLQTRLKAPDFPAGSGFLVEPRARVLHSGGSSVADLGRETFVSTFNHNLLRYAEIHHPQSIALIRFGLRLSNGLRKIIKTKA